MLVKNHFKMKKLSDEKCHEFNHPPQEQEDPGSNRARV
jgi:hypothetical protein